MPKIISTESCKCNITNEATKGILESLEEEMQHISSRVELEAEVRQIDVKGITLLLCQAQAKLTLEERRKKDGYELNVEVEYKPDHFYWGACGLGTLLLIIGMTITAYSWTPIVLTLLAGAACIGGAIFVFRTNGKKISDDIFSKYRTIIKDYK